jgi:protein-L-isoaspartate(D-aspartate) O-methyltransferase
MVETQIIARGIKDLKTIEAMSTVPRHLFVPDDLRNQAYSDYALPIGFGQTISQPYIVALMTASLELEGNEKTLEIGTGSGYQAAVLAEIVDHVYTIEIIPELARNAQNTLQQTGYTNVTIKNADGYFGWEEHHPYDIIIITAAVDHIPPPLIAQLKEGGRLILPLGNPLYYQTLTLVERQDDELYTTHILDVQFVPLTGYAQKGSEPEETEPEDEPKEEPTEPNKEGEEPTYQGKDRYIIGIIVIVGIGVYIVWKMSR